MDGVLEGVDPRSELELLREALTEALSAGEDAARFWTALAGLDPIAAADLATGAKATAAAAASALVILDALEQVLPGSRLYHRLADLMPARAVEWVALAARRHPTARWVVPLSQRHDPVPGRTHLLVAAEVGRLAEACALWVSAGEGRGLLAVSGELPSLEPTLALIRGGAPKAAARCAAALLDAQPGAQVLPTLAALYGPDLDDLTLRIVGHLTRAEAREALATTVSGLPRTRAAL